MYETAKIAICFHLGYNYMFEEFTKYIDSVLSYDPSSHLYITYQCLLKSEKSAKTTKLSMMFNFK